MVKIKEQFEKERNWGFGRRIKQLEVHFYAVTKVDKRLLMHFDSSMITGVEVFLSDANTLRLIDIKKGFKLEDDIEEVLKQVEASVKGGKYENLIL